MFQKATRQRTSLKIAVTGPSGSGKTYSALMLAFGLAGEGRIAVVDTENGSASLYSHLGDFDVAEIHPPFTADKYIAAIQAASRGGYDVLIIDSLTHLWAGEGGLLEQKDALDKRGGNSYTNWAQMTRFFEQFKGVLLQSPVHVIGTVRSKQDYVLEADRSGKMVPKKVGMGLIQRDGLEYEFTTVFDVTMSHEALTSKDRTEMFDGFCQKITRQTGQKFRDWLGGAAALSTPAVIESPAPQAESVPAPEKPAEPELQDLKLEVTGVKQYAKATDVETQFCVLRVVPADKSIAAKQTLQARAVVSGKNADNGLPLFIVDPQKWAESGYTIAGEKSEQATG